MPRHVRAYGLRRNLFASRAAFSGIAAMMLLTVPAPPAAASITVTSDPILYWNDRAVALTALGPPAQTRAAAMMNIAMHDAINSILGGPDRSYLSGVAGFGGDIRAATAQAAYQVLSTLDPARASAYATARQQSFAVVSDPVALANGIATGSAFAGAILGLRANDGANAVATYTPTGAPGNWVPTSPAPPAFPQWGGVTPFLVSDPDQFAPAPPPAIGTSEYAAAVAEVRAIGALNSITRTPDQTASALFWDNADGLAWVKVGLIVGEDEALSTIDYARAFSLLTVSLADAAIIGFDAKYEDAFWRPITAIANDPTNPDPSWRPLFTTPNHPSYPSAHSFFSGVGETVLTAFFGDDEPFTMTIATDTRSFVGLHDAALDGANSRLWGGIHFSTDNEAGLLLGREVARAALDGPIFATVPEPATWTMMIIGFGMTATVLKRQRRGEGRRRIVVAAEA